jgi:sugar phosphate isomerase/epimerase
MGVSRRTFVHDSLVTLAAAGGMLVAGQPSAAGAQKRRWKAGLGLNGFMSSGADHKVTYPIWEILAFAVGQKFDGIELVQGWPMGDYPAPDNQERVAALRGLYQRYGLQVYTIQPGGGGCPYHADKAERERWLREYRDQIRLCKSLGGEFIGHWPGGGLQGNAGVDQAIDHAVASYKEAAKMVADVGMWISFEIEPPFLFNTLDHLQRLLAGVNHPAFKTNYDPSHFDVMSGSKGKPEEMLRIVGVKNIGHVHLTDTDGTIFGGTSKHLACGDGHCDIRQSLKVLWDGGYEGWIMIDGWKIQDVYDAARKGKAAIDRAIREFS